MQQAMAAHLEVTVLHVWQLKFVFKMHFVTTNLLRFIKKILAVIVPAGIGTASIFFVSLILTVCGFGKNIEIYTFLIFELDIFNHMKIVIAIYFVLSWPIGLLGWFLFPIEIYWAMLW